MLGAGAEVKSATECQGPRGNAKAQRGKLHSVSQTLFDLSGRIAVVTGGTTGLGHAIALGLAEAGANVVPTSRRLQQVEKVAAEIEALGRQSLRVTSDVLHRASLEALRDAVLGAFGKVDILVNAAGVTHKGPTLDMDEADWARVMETNLTGTLRACQIFGKEMVRAGYGRIVNIASLTSFVAFSEVARVCGQQGRGGFADPDARRRTGAERGECECHRSRSLSNASECRADSRHAARRRVAAAHTHAPLWRSARSGGNGDISCLGGGFVCYR